MGAISTHVLDTSRGEPAAGLAVVLRTQDGRELGGVASQEFFPESSARRGDDVAGRALDRAADTWAAAVGLRGRVGSGGFVVGPGRSRSGRPILANDPHVELLREIAR